MKYIAIFAMALLLGIGCSKKQSEVDELEKELLGQQDTTVQVDAAVVEDDSAVDGQISAEAVPEEEDTYTPPEITGDGYTVQVAGCESEEYAQHLLDLYIKRGYEPFVTEVDVDGQIFFRVRIGQFEGFSEAASLKAELEDKYSLTAWVDNL